VLRRGWEGQEFDRKNPKKAAPILVNELQLEELKTQVEMYEMEKKTALAQKKDGEIGHSSRQTDLSGATMGSQGTEKPGVTAS
jgi:hypothetical protein